jgi:hypothetical protein
MTLRVILRRLRVRRMSDYSSTFLRELMNEGDDMGVPEAAELDNPSARMLAILLADYFDADWELDRDTLRADIPDVEMPDDWRTTEGARSFLPRNRTESVHESVSRGNQSMTEFQKGVTESKLDTTGNELIRNALAREGGHIHLFGPKNSGKTNKAHYWAVDVCDDVFDVVRSNLSALGGGDPYEDDEERVEGEFDHMSDFLAELHTDDQYVCRIIDEVSSAMNGYAFSKSKVETQMSQSINATRKYTEGGATNLITVSHRESLGDVHPIIIENADLLIQTYEGKYGKATVYKGHFDKNKVDLQERKITDMYGIPATTVEHSDSIMAKWWWDGDGYDYRVGLSSLDEPPAGKTGDEDTSTEPAPTWRRCRGSKKDGSRCGTVDGLDEEGFCRYHVGDEPHPDAHESTEKQ